MAVNVNELRNKVIGFVRINGPVLPVHISKSIGVDILFSGAVLSELVSSKQIKISNAKIGGSPVYYTPGQEPKLSILYKSLPEKERQAYDLLKENKILFDKEVEPAIRVALRFIKDFSVPINIMRNNQEETAWKWYLSTDQEINNILSPQPIQQEIPKPIQQVQTQSSIQQLEKQIQNIQPQVQLEIQRPQETIQEKLIQQKPQITKPRIRSKSPQEDLFFNEVQNYVKKNNIRILNTDEIKKNKEVNLIIAIHSTLGELEMFLHAKNKKKITEGDLSLAHHKGQAKKLPVLLLASGEISKKAEQYREKNLKGYLIFKTL